VTKRTLRLAWLVPAAMCLALAVADPAAACAVCTGGQTDQVRYAFLWTTGLLSALPLGLIGGVVWFVRRRARELAAKRAQPAEATLSRSAASR
jgi:hypothetical protein